MRPTIPPLLGSTLRHLSTSPRVARPRAATGSSSYSHLTPYILGLAVTLGLGVPLGYTYYTTTGAKGGGGGVVGAVSELYSRLVSLTTVDETDLMTILPPWETYVSEEEEEEDREREREEEEEEKRAKEREKAQLAGSSGSGSGSTTAGAAPQTPRPRHRTPRSSHLPTNRSGIRLPAPASTLVLGWEGACVDVVYDPKSGYVPQPREGLAPLFLALAQADTEVVVWSSTQQSAPLKDQLHAFLMAAVVPLDRPRFDAFNRFLEANYARALAVEVGMAAREGRPPRPMLPITNEDRLDLYAENVLRWVAVLGREHCVATSTAASAPAASGGGGGGGAAVAAPPAVSPVPPLVQPPSPTATAAAVAPMAQSTPQGPPHQVFLRPVNLLTHGRLPWDVVAVDCVAGSELGLEAPSGEQQVQREQQQQQQQGVEECVAARGTPLYLPIPTKPPGKAGKEDLTLPLLAQVFTGYYAWREREKGRRKGGGDGGGFASPALSIAVYLETKARGGGGEGRKGEGGDELEYSRRVFRAVRREVAALNQATRK